MHKFLVLDLNKNILRNSIIIRNISLYFNVGEPGGVQIESFLYFDLFHSNDLIRCYKYNYIFILLFKNNTWNQEVLPLLFLMLFSHAFLQSLLYNLSKIKSISDISRWLLYLVLQCSLKYKCIHICTFLWITSSNALIG